MLLRVNLVPQQPVAERIKKISPLILGVLVILLCIFFYFRITYIKNQINENQAQVKQVEETAGVTELLTKQVSDLETRLASLKSEYNSLKESVARAEGIHAEKNYYSNPLQDISYSLPPPDDIL